MSNRADKVDAIKSAALSFCQLPADASDRLHFARLKALVDQRESINLQRERLDGEPDWEGLKSDAHDIATTIIGLEDPTKIRTAESLGRRLTKLAARSTFLEAERM